MCEPTTMMAATMVATTAAQQGAQLISTSQRADQIEERNQQIAEEANENHTERLASMQLQNTQDEEAVGEKVFDQRRKNAQATARAKLSAQEAGVSGNSVEALFRDFERRQAEFEQDSMDNFSSREQQRFREMDASQEQAQARIRRGTQPVPEPDYFGAALRVGQSAANAYSQFDLGKTTPSPSPSPDPATRNATDNLKIGQVQYPTVAGSA